MNIIQIYRRFPNHQSCLEHLEKARWNGTPVCPYCNSTQTSPMRAELRHHCNTCNTSFSITVGTIFHKTKLDLQKWFLAISIILNAKKGISARQLARDIEVNRNTAWYMGMRIRRAMTQARDKGMLQGIVEMDETYIGGKPRKGGNGNDDGTPNKRGRGTKKIPIVGLAERGGKVKAKVSYKHELTANKLVALVRKHVNTAKTVLMTDEYRGYLRMSSFIDHKTINHQQWYVDGDIHTNTIESFWAILKRGIIGQYHKVSLHYLPKYIDEFCFRYNNRKNTEIFNMTLLKALEVRA